MSKVKTPRPLGTVANVSTCDGVANGIPTKLLAFTLVGADDKEYTFLLPMTSATEFKLEFKGNPEDIRHIDKNDLRIVELKGSGLPLLFCNRGLYLNPAALTHHFDDATCTHHFTWEAFHMYADANQSNYQWKVYEDSTEKAAPKEPKTSIFGDHPTVT